MIKFLILNIAGISLGLMLTLFVMMFAGDPRTTAGRKRDNK